MKIVLRIAGSILGSPPDFKVVERYTRAISELVSEEHPIAVVVGGGKTSRDYIGVAKKLGLPPTLQDAIGIQASRLNARLVAMKLGLKNSVPTSIEEMTRSLSKNSVAVMGGLKPGMTTDATAVLLAERWKADLIVKGSDQKGIYTSDPRLNKKAKKLDRISHARMQQILGGKHKPGMHSIVDPVAVKMLSKSRIRLVVLDGTKPRNVIAAVHGEMIGTLVSS